MHGLMMHPPMMISDIIAHAATVHGDIEIVARTIEGELHRYTYAEAHERCRRMAQALQKLGIAPGDRVGSLAWNTHHHFELFYAVSGTAAILHTINPRLFEDQIVYIADHAEDKWICVDGGTLSLAERIAPRLPKVRGWIYMGAPGSKPASPLAPLLDYEELLAASRPIEEWPSFDERQASTICYTSGTTGLPKGVVNSHRSTTLSALMMSTADMIGGYVSGARDAALPFAPLFHGNGWQMVYTAPMSGQKLVLIGRNFESDKLYELMAAEKVTIAAGVPTVWMGLVDHLDRNGLRLPKLRAALIAGTKPPGALIDALQRHGVDPAQVWGMTEALGPNKAALSPGMADASPEQRAAAKARQGRLGFGNQLRIVDDHGTVLPHDGQAFGHLQARGHLIAAAYYKREPERNDGWLDTGDVARIFPDGVLELVDRSKDVIKSGGEWISSVTVENAAMDHPAIAQAAVIGIPHPRWQERPLLIAVRRSGQSVDGDTLRTHLGTRMASWWLPDRIEFVDELPLTGTGKVNKVALRERFQGVRFDGT